MLDNPTGVRLGTVCERHAVSRGPKAHVQVTA